MKFTCAHCGADAEKPTCHVKRARAAGFRLFCDRKCAALGRRNHKTKAQRVEEKRIYDAEYRRLNLANLKAKKAAHHRATYDPEKAAIDRKKRAPQHAEYCRQPAYRARKSDYDRKRRAGAYGPAAEAYAVLLDLNREIKGRMSNHEIRQANDTFNKRQARAREASSDNTKAVGHRDRAA